MVFHWRLSDSKSPQVSRTLLSILAVFNNAVVWMVSTRSPTSKSSRPFNNPLLTVPKAPIPIGIIVTFMFHSFFNSQARSRYLSLFYYYYYYYYSLWHFYIRISWWSFIGVWVTGSFLRFPGLFSVFKPIITTLEFGWSQFLPLISSISSLFSNPPGTVSSAPTTVCITVIFLFVFLAVGFFFGKV